MSEGENLDFNKIAVEAAVGFVDRHIESILNLGKGVLKGTADSVRLRLNKSYKDYLCCIFKRYSRAKSFLIRDEPTYLYNFYVPVGLKYGRREIDHVSIKKIINMNPYVVITGGGGTGKSMLMRHLLLSAIEEREKVPIFIELRRLEHSEQSVLEFIQDTLHSNNFDLDDEFIEKAMKAGHFVFLFDGFDEISQSQRQKINNQIIKLVQKYDKNFVILSSRPDEEFSSWQSFSVMEMAPLTLEQACELIDKLDVEEEFKSKFMLDLRARLFEEHKSFLSNPLLLSIMFLTYGQSADIPSKLSLFYNQAYEVLFQRHDAFKGAYQRERLSKLDIQDFAKLFSAFSILTYDKRVFEFTKPEALEFIDKAKKLANINVNSNSYLVDAEQAVCLLIEEGLQIIFAHRSFQEYFVAQFINTAEPEVQQKLIEKYAEGIGRDSVLRLLYELNPQLVERTFIIPALTKLEEIVGYKKKVGITHYAKFVKGILGTINIDPAGHSTFSIDNLHWFYLIHFIIDTCGHLINFPFKDWMSRDHSLWEKFKQEDELVRVDLRGLKPSHPILRTMASDSWRFSQPALEALIGIKKQLLAKHQTLNESLEEILQSSHFTSLTHQRSAFFS